MIQSCYISDRQINDGILILHCTIMYKTQATLTRLGQLLLRMNENGSAIVDHRKVISSAINTVVICYDFMKEPELASWKEGG